MFVTDKCERYNICINFRTVRLLVLAVLPGVLSLSYYGRDSRKAGYIRLLFYAVEDGATDCGNSFFSERRKGSYNRIEECIRYR
jgi:hypothetical protein